MKRVMIRNILVPVDFSEMSIEAINIAHRLARRFTASIHLAHVRQFDYASGFSAPAPPMDPFSVDVPMTQEAEKNFPKNSTCWRANTASHRRLAMSSAADLHSMKSVESRRTFLPISS